MLSWAYGTAIHFGRFTDVPSTSSEPPLQSIIYTRHLFGIVMYGQE